VRLASGTFREQAKARRKAIMAARLSMTACVMPDRVKGAITAESTSCTGEAVSDAVGEEASTEGATECEAERVPAGERVLVRDGVDVCEELDVPVWVMLAGSRQTCTLSRSSWELWPLSMALRMR